MKLKKFAEALIFQCLEDLYDPRHMPRSVEFFYGKNFHMVATMAEMNSQDRARLMRVVNTAVKSAGSIISQNRPKQAGRAKNLPSCPACPPQHHVVV